MANEKILNTRIQLKYGTLSEWQAGKFNKTEYLKKGELAIVTLGPDVETQHPADTTNQHPLLFKVGTGEHYFDALPWASALAADVYDWAKKASPDWNDFPEIPGAKFGITVEVTGSGNAITGASWNAATKTLTLTKGETFLKASEFVDTTYEAGTKLELKGTTFNHEATTRTDTSDTANAEFGKAIEVIDSVTSDETGHITAVNKKTITLPTPEKVILPTVNDNETKGQVVVEVDQTDGAIDVKRKAIDVNYDSASRKIQLKVGGDLIGDGFDASDFIKDGMIKTVELVDVNDKNVTGKFLKITWNTPELDDDDVITYVDLTTLIDVYTAGDGIDIDGKVISHADTSSVTNVAKTDRTYISGIEFDEFGHVTKVETGVETDQELPVVNDGKFTVSGTGYLTGSGSMTANQEGNTSATLDLTDAAKEKIDNAIQEVTAGVGIKATRTGTTVNLEVVGKGETDDDGNEVVWIFDCGGAQ